MAYSVARRTGEIGIRMALGAQSGQVLRMILREASWMVCGGVAIGSAVALAAIRSVSTMLYGLKPDDPGTMASAAALLLAIALLAAWPPRAKGLARRSDDGATPRIAPPASQRKGQAAPTKVACHPNAAFEIFTPVLGNLPADE